MATMISEVYDAFISSYENRLSGIERDFAVLKRMTGTVLAGVAALVIKAFFT